jgi:AbiU2
MTLGQTSLLRAARHTSAFSCELATVKVMAPNGPPPMTEEEYWRDYEIIRDDVSAAMVSCYTHRAINDVAAADVEILEKMNTSAEFWNVTSFALQNTLFIVLYRILDTDPNLHSVHKVLNATTAHPEFFSRASLKRRKLSLPGANWDLAFLDRYVADAWEPTAADLREFKKQLRPHKARFDEIYRPVRDQIAHIIHKDKSLIGDLYSRTQKAHIDEILRFLHLGIKALWEIAHNGERPDFNGSDYGYGEKVARIKRETEEMLHRLP